MKRNRTYYKRNKGRKARSQSPQASLSQPKSFCIVCKEEKSVLDMIQSMDETHTYYCLNPYNCLYEWLLATNISHEAKEIALSNWYLAQLNRSSISQIPTDLGKIILSYMGLNLLRIQSYRSEVYANGWESFIELDENKKQYYEDELFPLAYLGRFVYASPIGAVVLIMLRPIGEGMGKSRE